MTESDLKTRYVYVKNGNCVEQIKQVQTRGEDVVAAGPDAFLSDFVRRAGFSELLLMSVQRAKAEYNASGIRALAFDGGTNRWVKLIRKPLASLRILAHLVRFAPDKIVCGASEAPLWVCTLYAKVSGVPLVHSRHNQVVLNNSSELRAALTKIDHWCIRQAAAVVCHGPFLVDEIHRIGVPKERIVNFDVTLQPLIMQRKAYPTRQVLDKPSILYFGRMGAEKGIFELLEASMPLLTRENPWRLTYVGDGTDRHRLQQRVEQLGLSTQIDIVGNVDHDELIHWLMSSCLVATPSRPSFPEGRCMSAMEALAFGKPVLAPDYGPFPYLIENGTNGILFKAGDVQSMSAALTRIADDEALYQHLVEGALVSAEELAIPERTFAEAVAIAFGDPLPN